jgi:ribonuclease P protein component
LRQQERLTKSSDFKRVYGSGKSVADRLLVLYRLPYADELKLGISVSKKVQKGSVGRNRLKRLVRESFRRLSPRLNRGYHLIVIVRVAARNASYRQIAQSLSDLCKRSGLVMENGGV